MARLGIISGTIAIGRSFASGLQENFVETDYGHAVLYVSKEIAFLPRHGIDPDNHILPHMINYRANLLALKELGVREIVSLNSSGSLKKNLKPGTIVIPDDFISLSASPSIFSTTAVHVTPALDEGVRQKLISASRDSGADTVDRGVYWQTPGPRLETRAEIRFMSQHADIVGMTMASEAVIANEMDVNYASLCSVDNFAHGLVENPLTMEEIMENSRKNLKLIINILQNYIDKKDLKGTELA